MKATNASFFTNYPGAQGDRCSRCPGDGYTVQVAGALELPRGRVAQGTVLRVTTEVAQGTAQGDGFPWSKLTNRTVHLVLPLTLPFPMVLPLIFQYIGGT